MKEATVIIPAFNESRRIPDLLSKISRKYEIIVVDDCSNDNTVEIVKKAGCKCIKLDKNMGKGYACRIGAQDASANKIVFIDADNQFNPSTMPDLIKALDEYDIVIGSRKINSIPFQRKLSNRLSRWAVNKITKKNYKDVLCGYRAIRKDVFDKLNLEKNRYEFESEMLIKASKVNCRIKELDVDVSYGGNHGMPLKNSIWLSFYIIKELIKSVV